MNVKNRTIFEGDNLHILRGFDSETIDLIYLDPPSNSNKTYAAHPDDASMVIIKAVWQELRDAGENEGGFYHGIE